MDPWILLSSLRFLSLPRCERVRAEVELCETGSGMGLVCGLQAMSGASII